MYYSASGRKKQEKKEKTHKLSRKSCSPAMLQVSLSWGIALMQRCLPAKAHPSKQGCSPAKNPIPLRCHSSPLTFFQVSYPLHWPISIPISQSKPPLAKDSIKNNLLKSFPKRNSKIKGVHRPRNLLADRHTTLRGVPQRGSRTFFLPFFSSTSSSFIPILIH